MILDEHFPKQHESECDAVHRQIVRMGGMAESQLQRVIAALGNGDVALAHRADDAAHTLQATAAEIGDMCNRIILNCCLPEDDLRAILAAIKIVDELQRIGDTTNKILHLIHQVSQKNSSLMLPRYSYAGIKQSATMAYGLLHNALDSYAGRDPVRAAQVTRHDEGEVFDVAIHFLVNCIIENPRTLPAILEMILIARATEGLTAHARNISGHVTYMISGHDNILTAPSECLV